MSLFSRFHYATHFERHCKGKGQYTKAGARTRAAQMTAFYGEAYEHYRCMYCRRWHVGHAIRESA